MLQCNVFGNWNEINFPGFTVCSSPEVITRPLLQRPKKWGYWGLWQRNKTYTIRREQCIFSRLAGVSTDVAQPLESSSYVNGDPPTSYIHYLPKTMIVNCQCRLPGYFIIPVINGNANSLNRYSFFLYTNWYVAIALLLLLLLLLLLIINGFSWETDSISISKGT